MLREAFADERGVTVELEDSCDPSSAAEKALGEWGVLVLVSATGHRRAPGAGARFRRSHAHWARCSGKMPRCPKSVAERWKRVPSTSIVQWSGRRPRPCQRLPSSRSKLASAFAHSASGRAGRHTAWAAGRASTTRPKRSSLRPAPLSSSSYPSSRAMPRSLPRAAPRPQGRRRVRVQGS